MYLSPDEPIDLGDGYTAEVAYDYSPACPFTSWDGEPPLTVFHDGCIDHYPSTFAKHDELTLCNLLGYVPAGKFRYRKFREQIGDLVGLADTDFEQMLCDTTPRDGENWKNAVIEAIACYCADSGAPRSYFYAREYFELLAWVCDQAGIACHWEESTGYCQGHYALVFAAALPQWAAGVGAPKKSHKDQCRHACELYGYWAWGDVFGVVEITDPDGHEIPDASVWGFYGTDPEDSGLLDHCRTMKSWWQGEREKESAESFAMACRDILTV